MLQQMKETGPYDYAVNVCMLQQEREPCVGREADETGKD